MAKTESNKKENERVRKAISEALFDLLMEKDMSSITVTDLVTKAHVARASYYRNFSCKEDILKQAMDVIRDRALREIRLPEGKSEISEADLCDMLERIFSIFLSVKSYFLTLHHSGFSVPFLMMLDDCAETLFGFMPQNSIEKYQVYYFAGGIYNIAVTWLESGARESPHALAEFCAKRCMNLRTAG